MADVLSGADAFIEQLIAGGVRYVFGNPGTTEQPFLGRLGKYPELNFVTALHESVAVCAAEGYARATGKVGVVELHAGPGLGNGLGMLYNAAEGRTPLLVYVGQVEQHSLYLEPTLSGDFVAMAHPVAKWAYEVRTADEIPQIVRRALKVAATEPCGPVVLSIPMDLMEQPCNTQIAAPSTVSMAVSPDPAAVETAAELIARADAPVVLVGDGVARSGAIRELSEFAQLIGAPIYGAFMTETCVDPDEPLDAGRLPSIEGAAAARQLQPFDAVIAIGTKVLSQIFPIPGLPLGDRDVVHIGLDTWELAKNQPSAVVYGDERASLRALLHDLTPRLAPRRAELQDRRAHAEERIAATVQKAIDLDHARWDELPMSPERAVAELAALMPAGACLVDESLTAYTAVARYFRFEPGRWFRLRGGGIGEGMPMPIGVQLGHPDLPVVALVGDGSSLYSITALWTAAHHRLPITWVILNNHSYRVLKENARRESASTTAAEELVGADLTDPQIDFVSLALGFGVEAHRVTTPDEIRNVFPAALAADHPVLIDMSISGALTKR
jgi:thiamine pyrophosphate-dependent acetolactate synthase large subunit-like protein